MNLHRRDFFRVAIHRSNRRTAAAVLEYELHCPVESADGSFGVDTALETMRCFAVQSQTLSRASNRQGCKMGTLKKYRLSGQAHFGVHAAHHPRKCYRSVAVANHQVLVRQVTLDTVQRHKLAVFTGIAHD